LVDDAKKSGAGQIHLADDEAIKLNRGLAAEWVAFWLIPANWFCVAFYLFILWFAIGVGA
jgi:hypothetical protein